MAVIFFFFFNIKAIAFAQHVLLNVCFEILCVINSQAFTEAS